MGFIFLVSVLSIFFVPGLLGDLRKCQSQKLSKKWPEFFVDLQIDNFNKSDTRTYKHRYLQYDDHFEKDGPIFIYIIYESYNIKFLKSVAKKAKGVLIVFEHRYTRSSFPSKVNYNYLSSQQALADIANFIQIMKKKEQYKNSKVVTIGSSYPGSLAAWMRSLYPRLVDAAWSSSAPLLAKANVSEYYDRVTEAYKKYGPPECVLLKTGYYTQLRKKMQNALEDTSLYIYLMERYNWCTKYDGDKEFLQYFFFDQTHVQTGAVESGIVQLITDDCENYGEETKLDAQRKNPASSHLPYDTCHEYNLTMDCENRKRFNDTERSWLYQQCTEFGLFTPTSNNSMFGGVVPYEFFINRCKYSFGVEFDEARVEKGVKATNERYRGLKPNASKVVFFNGGMDPWSSLELKHNVSVEAPVFLVPDVSIAADINASPDDPQELVKVREAIVNLILQWIGKSNAKN